MKPVTSYLLKSFLWPRRFLGLNIDTFPTNHQVAVNSSGIVLLKKCLENTEWHEEEQRQQRREKRENRPRQAEAKYS